MLKMHNITLHHVITVYNDMFDHMDSMIRDLAKKKTPWENDFFFPVKLAQQKLCKYYVDVTSTMGIFLISTHILDSFRKLRWFRKLDKRMDNDPEDETSYTTQYHQAFLKYVENEYCAKHLCVTVNKHQSFPSSNLIHSAMVSGSYQWSFDLYAFCSDDEQFLMTNNVAEIPPGRSDNAAHLLTGARLYCNSPPEAPKNWRLINRNRNDYHSDPIEISNTFWLPDITDWWSQQEETHSKYADLSNEARDIFSIIPHGVVVEASFPLAKMWSAGGSQKPQARPFAKRSL